MDKHNSKNFEEETLSKAFDSTKQKLEEEISNNQKSNKESSHKQSNGNKVENGCKKENETTKEINNTETSDKKMERGVSCEEYLKLKYQLADMINKYRQLNSEFENYRKRTREELSGATLNGKVKAIELIIPALDSFKKAKLIVTDPKNLEGINLIEKSLMASLEKQGVKKINCIGKPFNADFHNAIAIVEDKTKKSGIVIDEVESGYTLGDKVIKFSQVVVNK